MNSPDVDEQLEADVYSNLPSRNDSSTGRRNRSSCRSKHSETEQRRRSKINERFQSLMDIIPQNQNDQKRDKASFLLEVIEYIHFLQEKVHMYEGSDHQMWDQGPTKLIPWRNNYGSVVEVNDHPQIGKSFSSNDNVAATSGLLPNMQNYVDPDIDSAVNTKILEDCPVSAVSSYLPTEPSLQFVQHDFWQPKPVNCNTDDLFNSNENTSTSLSTVCTQRVLHTLTEALKSSGVNMPETMISVQLSLRKRADREYSVAAFASEDNCNSIADEEGDSPTETRSFCSDIDHSQKRLRR
ncbi:Myc-type basic helix-loop-helix (bHLH) domain [Arabidopsis thaliana x Arabidopsis arenosa]|uniref:Myc-type basic helix-loop-helix (BHLH) domain n=1 Tax=Arabidopsis thaliana x Arabidopsis arenosa TaxID=1240361 RepID=A0A8T1YD17_9BRAS|nr:Myc-type basic helix-loop-helix (bHLH) domain [Arabidopsis thaliana x Arabidopsis arenosa]